jgi:prolyl-tRNA editing enzyme YbaK/EbsC (Cys-tRNA(Pro) deacylase)
MTMNITAGLSTSAKKVQDALVRLGVGYKVVELLESTRTAEDAAQAVGCDVRQIIKSIIFKTRNSGMPILVLVSGSNRINELKIGTYLQEPVEKAKADFVREKTGYAIGGIPPIGFSISIQTFIDQDLMDLEVVWAAAGTPNAIFSINPKILPELTGGKIVDIQ